MQHHKIQGPHRKCPVNSNEKKNSLPRLLVLFKVLFHACTAKVPCFQVTLVHKFKIAGQVLDRPCIRERERERERGHMS